MKRRHVLRVSVRSSGMPRVDWRLAMIFDYEQSLIPRGHTWGEKEDMESPTS
jgi:hypothetical protein